MTPTHAPRRGNFGAHRSRTLLVVVVALSLALALVASARAGNTPDPRLDAVATEIAAHPVNVWCETDSAEWARTVSLVFGPDIDPIYVRGYTFVTNATVNLAPIVCLTLLWELSGRQGTPPPYLPRGVALLTLIHEAVHQRGVRDEGIADCIAIKLVPRYATTLFGIPATVAKWKYVSRSKRVRVNGRLERRRVRVRIRVIVPNPQHVSVVRDAENARFASPHYRDCAGIG
jgi:hypothetical protein